MENKMTAVQWFAEKDTELTISFLEGNLSQIEISIEKFKCLQQAIEMEKEQMQKAIQFGYSNDDDFAGIDYFYEITFNGGKNICPNCKQGILRMERPGKIGCSVC